MAYTTEFYLAMGMLVLFVIVLAVFIYLFFFPSKNGFDRKAKENPLTSVNPRRNPEKLANASKGTRPVVRGKSDAKPGSKPRR